MTTQTRNRLMDRKIVELLIQKKNKREITRLLGVGDRRVNKIQTQAEQYDYLSCQTPLPPYPETIFPDSPHGRQVKPSDPNFVLSQKEERIIERLRAN